MPSPLSQEVLNRMLAKQSGPQDDEPDPGADQQDDGAPDDLETCAADLLAGVRRQDTRAIAQALSDAFDVLSSAQQSGDDDGGGGEPDPSGPGYAHGGVVDAGDNRRRQGRAPLFPKHTR